MDPVPVAAAGTNDLLTTGGAGELALTRPPGQVKEEQHRGKLA